jgi:hypothetical protein
VETMMFNPRSCWSPSGNSTVKTLESSIGFRCARPMYNPSLFRFRHMTRAISFRSPCGKKISAPTSESGPAVMSLTGRFVVVLATLDSSSARWSSASNPMGSSISSFAMS